MPGPAPKPAAVRRTRHKPVRGEWQPTPGVGWQHGAVPKPPEGLLPASLTAWSTWMEAWFASHWLPADLPGLRQVIRLYDQLERGEFQRSAEVRMGMDGYGITPKGQQDRRWAPPKAEDDAHQQPDSAPSAETDPYRRLRAVS